MSSTSFIECFYPLSIRSCSTTAFSLFIWVCQHSGNFCKDICVDKRTKSSKLLNLLYLIWVPLQAFLILILISCNETAYLPLATLIAAAAGLPHCILSCVGLYVFDPSRYSAYKNSSFTVNIHLLVLLSR